jgi:hypothetical protein
MNLSQRFTVQRCILWTHSASTAKAVLSMTSYLPPCISFSYKPHTLGYSGWLVQRNGEVNMKYSTGV